MKQEYSESGSQPSEAAEAKSFWFNHFIQMRKLGLSRAAYCREHHLSYTRSQYWYQKFCAKPSPTWIPVQLKTNATPLVWCRIECSNHTSIAICSKTAFEHLLAKVFPDATVV
jgi:hypothetical protein